MHTTTIGNRGEEIAADLLSHQGYKLLERNWKTKWAEVDIIAKKDKIIYFVEVKYRSSARQGDGLDYITDKKLHHMIRAAELWVVMHKWDGEYQLIGASVDGITKLVDLREIV